MAILLSRLARRMLAASTPPRNPLSRFGCGVLTVLALLSIAGAIIYFGLVGDLPQADALITRSSPDTTKIYDRNGRLLYEVLDPRAGRRTRVPLSELPLNLQHAMLAVEDASFYQNPGVDPAGIVRALWQNIRAGEIVSGASTITQQLARELLLSKDESASRSVTRKLREMVLALRLTQAYPKDKILEMYLNEVYFGQLSYGAEAAARTYFGKPARDLDLAESALLAGLIQSPAAYNPLVNLDAAQARQKVVLDLMVKHRYITGRDESLALAEPLHFIGRDPNGFGNTSGLLAPHFVTYVRNLLEEEYGAEAVNHGGLRVITTLDLNLQERAEAVVKYNVDELARRTRQESAPDYNLHDAALVAVKPDTGEILALVGSADYFDAGIDGAVDVALANRQPGSAIKPITYATAFARDLTPATVVSDVPTTFLTKENEPYEPLNYDQVWHGPISLRTALATSSNMAAVKVLDHVGIDAMIKTAKALGISTFDDSDRFGLALTLGGGEVKLLELTAAYAAFANGGKRVEPIAILSVNGERQATRGDQRPEGVPAGPPAVSPQVAYLISNILSDDGARIPAFGEDSILNLSRPAAAKTGTTTDFRDNWTVGYTPDLAVGVWAGNADNEPMYKVTGITGAAPIWHDFMEEALKGTPPRDFPRPDGIIDVEICETSGLLPTKYCPRRRSEVFITGTEPSTYDDTYVPVTIDSATGLLWTDAPDGGQGCRGQRVERVYRLFQPDAMDWALKQGMPQPPEMNCLGQVADPVAPTSGLASKAATSAGHASNLQTAAGNMALVITSPAPNSIFELSPQIPTDMQQVEVSARLGGPSLAPFGASVDPSLPPFAASADPSPPPLGVSADPSLPPLGVSADPSLPPLTKGGRGGVRSVTLQIDGKSIATFTAPPYRALWKLTPGEHQIQAIGTNADGGQVESAVSSFTVTEGQ
jgi:1A family penicillin-binding protein